MSYYAMGVGAEPSSAPFALPNNLQDGVSYRLDIKAGGKTFSQPGYKTAILYAYEQAMAGAFGTIEDMLIYESSGRFVWQASQHRIGEAKPLLGTWAMAGIGLTLVVLFLGGGRGR